MTAILLVLAQQVARTEVPSGALTPFAAVFMTVSMGFVTLLTVWVFVRILRRGVQYEASHELDAAESRTPGGSSPSGPER